MSIIVFVFHPGALASNFENMRFEHITTKDGLTQNTVQAIYQDNVGFLWFGTQEGLNRYDGKEIKVFRTSSNDPYSLSHDNVRSIIQDRDNNLWVATYGGLSLYHGSQRDFENITIRNSAGYKVELLNTVYAEKSGRLWIGTRGEGLFVSSSIDNVRTFKPFTKIKVLTNLDIRTVFEDSLGRLWVGSDGEGVFLINQDRDSYRWFKPDKLVTDSLSHGRVRAITEDYLGNIWIGTRGGGLNRYQEGTDSFKHYKHNKTNKRSLSNNRVYRIFEDRKNTLWVTTDKGISIYQPETDDFIQVQANKGQTNGLNHDRILSIFQDNSGLMWFGSMKGINHWNPINAAFHHYQANDQVEGSLSNNHVYGIAEDHQGNIPITTFLDGLNLYSPNTKRFKHLSNSQSRLAQKIAKTLTVLMIDESRSVWVGSAHKGAYLLSTDYSLIKHFEFKKDKADSLSANSVTDIFQDRDGDIWIATFNGGLNRLNGDGESFTHYRAEQIGGNAFTSESVMQLLQDEEGYLWLAVFGGGLVKFDKESGRIKVFSHLSGNDKSLSHNAVLFIFLDSKKRLWIGTEGGGLNRWERESRLNEANDFIHYDFDSGLNSSGVLGITEDNSGNLWISTNRGVSKLNPETNVIKNYPLADEIHYNEPSQSGIYKTTDGRIYIGGLNGISAFYPSEIKDNENLPKVVLTQVLNENKTIKIDTPFHQLKAIEFGYLDYLLAFEFAALDFSNSMKNQYQYKLEGFDEDWIESGTLNRATYTNLPSGQYVFKVRGSNNDGYWSDDSINLNVIINPPPWATWWAYTLYLIGFIVALFGFIHSKIKAAVDYSKNLEKEVAERTNLVEEQRKTIETMLARKNELFANVSHEFRTPLTLILGPIAELIQQSDDSKQKSKMNIVERNAKRLLLLVEQLLNLASASKEPMAKTVPQQLYPKLKYIVEAFHSLADDKNISIKLYCDVHIQVMASEGAIETVVSNLLSNAIKYARRNSCVSLKIALAEEKVVMELHNQGSVIAIDDQNEIFERFTRLAEHKNIQGIGIGLAVVKELAQVNGATINVVSSQDSGTTFSLAWPSASGIASSNKVSSEVVSSLCLTATNESDERSQSEVISNEAETAKNEGVNQKNHHTHILVVEDNEDMRQYICDVLKPHYQCMTAINGQDGLEHAIEHIPDLIISDLMMPIMDGFELAHELRADSRTSHIPIILLTAKGDKESRLLGWRENIDEYLIKPFDSEELLLRIENILAIRKLLQQRFRGQLRLEESQVLPSELFQFTDASEAQNGWGQLELEFINKFSGLMEECYTNPDIKVSDIAKRLYLTEGQLRRKLKALLNTSPADLLRNYRLQKAASALIDGMNVSEIYLSVGFSSHSYFSRCFKVKYGTSPKNYVLVGS